MKTTYDGKMHKEGYFSAENVAKRRQKAKPPATVDIDEIKQLQEEKRHDQEAAASIQREGGNESPGGQVEQAEQTERAQRLRRELDAYDGQHNVASEGGGAGS